jgi:hypothetical protein
MENPPYTTHSFKNMETPNEHKKKNIIVFAQIGRLADKGAKMAYHINKTWAKEIGEI